MSHAAIAIKESAHVGDMSSKRLGKGVDDLGEFMNERWVRKGRRPREGGVIESGPGVSDGSTPVYVQPFLGYLRISCDTWGCPEMSLVRLTLDAPSVGD